MTPEGQAVPQTDWDAEYHFWHRLITGEVERLRFNQGFEPVVVELQQNLHKKDRTEPDFIGETQIGRRRFRAVGRKSFDAEGAHIIKVEIYPKELTEAEKARLWAHSSKKLYNEDKK